jgi:hypothetical protein
MNSKIFEYIDRIPILPLAVVAVFMALAPFKPEPHLLEKTRMLFEGQLTRGIDIFDLFWHSLFIVLLIIRLARYNRAK